MPRSTSCVPTLNDMAPDGRLSPLRLELCTCLCCLQAAFSRDVHAKKTVAETRSAIVNVETDTDDSS